MTRILAIDPGVHASAVVYSPDCRAGSGMRWHLLDVPAMENSRPDARALRDFIRKYDPEYAFIESVGVMPGQGISSSGKFMRATGVLEGVCWCFVGDVKLIVPQRWKKYHGIPTGSDKEASRQLALRLAPELEPVLRRKKDHNRSESVLLALYGAHCLAPISAT